MDAADALYVGLISGTSADGIDAVLVDFAHGQPRVHASHVEPWPEGLRHRLLAAAQPGAALDLDTLGRLDVEAGEGFAAAALHLLQASGTAPDTVRAIGSHGQTVRHRPADAHPFSLQIGDPTVIAERCGIEVVADFRRADVAAGGQGAPLVPALHAMLFADPPRTTVVLNLGGIANISVLRGDGDVLGFDTGPASCLMDAWCLAQRGAPFDRDGAFAASGHVDAALLAELVADPYFAAAAPKSTGREYFHLDWLRAHARLPALAAADVQATLLELTARSVALAVQQQAAGADRVLVCGGGVHNGALMHRLRTLLRPAVVESTACAGLDPDYVEAVAFAWLARQRLLGLPGNVPAVTGARGPRVLGAVHAAPRRG